MPRLRNSARPTRGCNDFICKNVQPVSVLQRDALTSQLFRRLVCINLRLRYYQDSNLTPRTRDHSGVGTRSFEQPCGILSSSITPRTAQAIWEGCRIVIRCEGCLSQQMPNPAHSSTTSIDLHPFPSQSVANLRIVRNRYPRPSVDLHTKNSRVCIYR